jgi:rhomboid protease GluP
MAFGFPPSFSQNLNKEHYADVEFLTLSIESILENNWEIINFNKNKIIAFTNNGFFSWNAEIIISIANEEVEIKSSSTGTEIHDWGKNKKNIHSFIESFNKIKESISTEYLSKKVSELEEEFSQIENNLQHSANLEVSEKKSDFISIFKPVKGYFITPVLIDLNIIIFTAMLLFGVDIFIPSTEDLIIWGANFRPATIDGEWWRLLTSCFLHIGIFHLLLNMYALMYIGILLEPFLGKFKFASAYLITGIFSSVISLWWHDFTLSAGASGAIFGMYGVYIALFSNNLIENKTKKSLLTSILIFVVFSLMNGLKEGIDNAAHIGGLISGLIIGYTFTFNINEEENKTLKYKIVSTLAATFTFISILICSSLSDDLKIYSERMLKFEEMEKMALEVYSRVNYEPKDELLYDIKERGIYYWNENINLINELDKMRLPKEIHERNFKIKEYCELRIKVYHLLYKTISEDTDKYKSEIKSYDDQIQSIINEIKNN